MGVVDTASFYPESQDSEIVLGLCWDDIAARCSHQRVYQKDRSHSCFITTSQQELQNIQDWINYKFLKGSS